jgi:hypothetical protein
MDRSIAPFNAGATGGLGRTIRDTLVEVAMMLFGSATFQPKPSLEHEEQQRTAPKNELRPASSGSGSSWAG